MFEKVGVPILGIVENMAVHVCAKCGHVEHIFGEGGGKRMAAEYKMDYLGALPLDISIRVQADSGRPSVVADPDGEIAGIYKSVARQVAVKIAQQAKDFSSKFPTHHASPRTPEGGGDRTARHGRRRCGPSRRSPRPAVQVAVVMERETAPNRWEDWRFRICRGGAARGRLRPRGARPARRRQGAAHPAPGLHPRAVPRRGRGLLPEPQLRLAGLVRRLADRRRRPVAGLAGNGEPVVQRGRPLARRAGAGRQRAARRRSWPPGCRPTPTSTTGPSRSSGAGRSRSSPRASGK